MTIDATFWVAVSFFIFFGVLIYLKVPQKINNSLTDQINEMKKELYEAEKLKIEAKNLLSNYENKIDKSKKETQEIINLAKRDSEKDILEKMKKFHEIIENKKKNAEQKIVQMKEETRQINGVYSKEKLEKEYQRDIDFFQMVASLFESFESYQKGVAKKERVESYDDHLDNLAKESNNKSFPDYQKQRANEDGFDSHADKLKYIAEERKEIFFCGCKMTRHPPLCDASHSKF